MTKVKDYWHFSDGINDFGRALNTAAYYSRELEFPEGQFSFLTAVRPFGEGVCLHGSGPVSTTVDQGTVLINNQEGVGDFLTWDGNVPYRSGGAFDNIVICRGKGKKGGTAVKLFAHDASHRPGKWHSRRWMIFVGDGYGQFDIGMDIDGLRVPSITNPGNFGIRTVHLSEVALAGCLQFNLRALGVVGLFASGLETFAAGGSNLIEISDCQSVQLFGSMRSKIMINRSTEVILTGIASDIVEDGKSKVARYLVKN